MGDQFHSSGGEQNIAQGDHATGKLVNNHGLMISTTGDQAPAVNTQGDVTITYGVPFEKYEQVRDECERLKVEYGIKDAAFASFFRILNQENIPCVEWGAKLPEIAFRYKELLLRFEAVTSDDPQVQALKKQARQAIENGKYDRADALLNQAKERDRAAVATLKASLAEQQAALEKRQLSEAQSCVDQAKLQRLQYRYEKSAQYYQEAAAALPEGHKKERAEYLGAAGNDLDNIAQYAEVLSLYEQSLFIFHEIGNRQGEAKSLNNIGQIYKTQGDYRKALAYLEQSLRMWQEIGDKAGEGTTLSNIGAIYHAWVGYATALKYLEQSLAITQEIGDKKVEGATLNNISQIYDARGDYAMALKYLEQSLRIMQEIGDKAGKGTTLNNIGGIYRARGDYTTALKYLEQSLRITQEIGNKCGEAVTSWNLYHCCIAQDDMEKAAQHISHAIQLAKEINTPQFVAWLAAWRMEWALDKVAAMLWWRLPGLLLRWCPQPPCLYAWLYRLQNRLFFWWTQLLRWRQQNGTLPFAITDTTHERNTP